MPLGEIGARADDHEAPVHRADDPLPRRLVDRVRRRHHERAPLGGGDHGVRERVARAALHRRGEAEHIVLGEAVRGEHLRHLGAADGERPRLVEDGGVHLLHPLERAAVAHDDVAARRAVDPAEDRDRRREDERTGGRDDEHREHARPVARRPEGRDADDEGERGEPHRVPVGDALQRRLARLRAAHELDDARVLALSREREGADREHPFPVRAAAHEAGARCRGERERLRRSSARHRRATCPSSTTASQASSSPGRRRRSSPTFTSSAGTSSTRSPTHTARHVRRGVHERADRAARAPLGEALERLAPGLHEHDHEPGHRLPERDRGADRERRDEVGGEMALRRGVDRLPDHRESGDREDDHPEEMRGIARADEVQDARPRRCRRAPPKGGLPCGG